MFQNIEVQWKAKDPVRVGYRRSGKALGLQGNNRNKNNVRQPGSDGNDGLKGNNTVFNRFGGGSNRPGVDIFKEGAKLYSDPSLKKQGRAVQHPRQMKREPNIPTKRSLQQQQQSQRYLTVARAAGAPGAAPNISYTTTVLWYLP